MSREEIREKALKPRIGEYGDSRDNLWATCGHCGEPLIEAEVRPAAAGPVAHGLYACGAKYLAWNEPKQGPACIRSCRRSGDKTTQPAKEESKPEETILRFVQDLCELKPEAKVETAFLYIIYRGFSKQIVKMEPSEEDVFLKVIQGPKVGAKLRGDTLYGIHIYGIREEIVKEAIAEALREENQLEEESDDWH